MLIPAEIATDGHRVTVRVQISEPAMAAARAADLTNPISALADTMTRPLARVMPAETEVESGIGMGGESGRLTSLLVIESGAATSHVRLPWKRNEKVES